MANKIRVPVEYAEWDSEWIRFFSLLFDIQEWQTATLENAWADAGLDAAYYLDPWGTVHLHGTIDSGTGGTTALTLPEGFRPTGTIGFSCHGSLVTITSAGVLVPASSATVYLDSINFRVY